MAAPTVLEAGGYVMLIIDPQNDFHPEDEHNTKGGALAVKGAIQDSEKIIKLLETKKPAAVYVSLDTHTHTHIGHAGFWEPTPPPYTSFSVKDGEVMGSDKIVYTPKSTGDPDNDAALKTWVLEYIEKVPCFGKGVPLIWPTHCIEGSPGHAVYKPLKDALDKLAGEGVRIEYHIKGQNETTEMYSIFKAEMPAEFDLYRGMHDGNLNASSKIETVNSDVDDHANLKTDFNMELFNSVMGYNMPVVVCGEALSHCVNWSTRDLNNKKKIMKLKNPILLLTDASSKVAPPGAEDVFTKQTEAFLKYCNDNGVELTTTTSQGVQVGGRRRGRRAPTRRNRRHGKRRATRHRRR